MLFVTTCAVLFIAPLFASAAVFNADCSPEAASCQYRQCCLDPKNPSKCKSPSQFGVVGKTCKEQTPVGPASGKCVSYGVCKADTAPGVGGKGNAVDPGMSKLMEALSSLLKGLGGGSPPPSPPPPPPSGSQGCAQYYAVSQPSADPCAYYVPGAGTSSINLDTGTGIGGLGSGGNSSGNSVTDLISSLLGGSSGTGDSGTGVQGTGAGTGSTSVGINSGAISSSTAGGATGVGPNGPLGASGPHGEIRVLPNGATIVITNQNGESNSVVAGFMGSGVTGGGAPTGLVANWCKTRPWASNFLSFIIPGTFFDSLCTLRGYQVGISAQGVGATEVAAPRGTFIQNVTPAQSATNPGAYQPTSASPPMQVDIWAVPASAPLGGRTTIFWNSKNAASCTETSPDGSFSHTSLSGGGATVPLAGPTVFTISCVAADGTHATDDVTVNLAI